MRRDLLDYELPEELIASRPAEERDGARLLVVDRGLAPGDVGHAAVRDLDRHVPEGALLVVNDTRVVPARLLGWKAATGGAVELLLLRRLSAGEGSGAERWRAMGRASKPLRPGAEIAFDRDGALAARVIGRGEGGLLDVELRSPAGMPIAEAIEARGHVPLPHYLGREDDATDRERYQTIFAREPGAVAAPTAGLHLSRALLERLEARGVEIARVTLHVGLGTFQPVTALDLDDHPMHEEAYAVPAATAEAIARARARGAQVLAVGTTAVRALESAADPARPGYVLASAGETRLLIQPGYRFSIVDGLMTNFHLPRSTLLALVFAFAGEERARAAYRAAIEGRYRFYSYGDAMLILGERAP
ncbi:MAG: tRNA preQ1(34) S-adenosylmethionine ribosyltransferase-isomerase QueA [Polyangiaceae bacterium]|nr:tRNA preQ1(34) S-adenosylmethionine ribosyltransferase-isomerase QueA [Polyangiaceae bacterium]